MSLFPALVAPLLVAVTAAGIIANLISGGLGLTPTGG